MSVTEYPIILVDDDPDSLAYISALLHKAGVSITASLEDSREVAVLLQRHPTAVLLLDLYMPHVSGQDILQMVSNHFPDTVVIVLTATQDLETVVNCMKSGAFDYLAKPVDAARLQVSVHNALELLALRHQVSSLKHSILHGKSPVSIAFAPIVTACRRMHGIFHYIEAIATSREPVLIIGETGVGKELIAHAIHNASESKGKFVSVNIAGLDDTLFSDTLFGHRKGAFTGAVHDRLGLIAKAEGGTVFLDEIGDLNLASQVKLLRVLQDQHYQPLGEDIQIRSNVRFVMATNRNLKGLIDDGRFRQDLYYRLSVHEIMLPPLRERLEDIPLLLEHFVDEACQAMGKKVPDIPQELIPLLENHPFLGNVRELRAMVYNAVAQNQSRTLSLRTFRAAMEKHRPDGQASEGVAKGEREPVLAIARRFPTLREAERFLVEEALRRTKGNQGTAATLLGLSRQALNRRLARHYALNQTKEGEG